MAFSLFSYCFAEGGLVLMLKKRYNRNKGILEWYDALAVAVAVIALIFTFVIRIVQVDGGSMNPSLFDGERILIATFLQPDYGDVVIIDSYIPYGKPLVKRVIGMAGDTIDIDFQTGIVYRNGQALSEPYTAEPTWTYEGVDFPLTVPEGCLFIMGDNRNNSKDSRDAEIGCVDTRDVLGVAIWRLLPFGKMGAAE